MLEYFEVKCYNTFNLLSNGKKERKRREGGREGRREGEREGGR